MFLILFAGVFVEEMIRFARKRVEKDMCREKEEYIQLPSMKKSTSSEVVE